MVHEAQMQKGDMIYMFSDGYYDQFGGKEDKRFTSSKFKELLNRIHETPMHEQKEMLNKKLEDWKENFEQVDDILVMGIKI